jgi:hypothetical protein
MCRQEMTWLIKSIRMDKNLTRVAILSCQIKKGLTSISSAGVFSETSLKMTMHLLWLGLTFRPSSSTWTIEDSAKEV